MLTPLGAGAAASRPRRWPKVLAALLALSLLGGAAYGSWWWFGQGSDDEATPSVQPTRICTTPTPKTPKRVPDPAEITVAVGNGTDRTGLAVETADALALRGFLITSIGNADQPVKEGIAQVRFAKGDLASAVVVASYVPGAELVEVNRAPDIQLWLGPDFDDVVKTEDADPSSVPIPAGEPNCAKPDRPDKPQRTP